MSDHLEQLKRTLQNPFVQLRVDNAWDRSTVDVPQINGRSFDEILQLVQNIRQTGASHGLLLHGEAGAGKTHLLARARRWVQEDGRAWFVYVLPVTSPERFHRHLLASLVSDVTRSLPEADSLSQLAIVVARHFMADIQASVPAIAEWWRRVRVKHPEGDPLAGFLLKHLEALVTPLELDHAVVRVVAELLSGRHRNDARSWLLGRSLPEERLARLGVGESLDSEEEARSAVTTLVRLASENCTVLFAFDQLEGLQIDAQDSTGLVGFAAGVTSLLSNHRNVGVISAVQNVFHQTLRDALGEANWARVGERQSSLTLLEPSDAVLLVSRKLEREVDLQAVRIFNAPAVTAARPTEPAVWPLDETEVRQLATPHVTARNLIRGCHELFNRWLERKEPELSSPEEPATLEDAWENSCSQAISSPMEVLDEGVYADGILKIVDAVEGSRLTSERPKARDIDAVIHDGKRRVAVSICNAENMTSLSARFKRLSTIAGARQFDRLVLIRDQRLPIKPGARATREHLSKLREAGVTVIEAGAETYAALVALRKLLADAAAGDLTIGGRRVESGELKKWLAANCPLVLRDLVQELVGSSSTAAAVEGDGPGAVTLNLVIELLRASFVCFAGTIAQKAGMTEDELEEMAAANGTLLGYIGGESAVMFLKPDAMERL